MADVLWDVLRRVSIIAEGRVPYSSAGYITPAQAERYRAQAEERRVNEARAGDLLELDPDGGRVVVVGVDRVEWYGRPDAPVPGVPECLYSPRAFLPASEREALWWSYGWNGYDRRHPVVGVAQWNNGAVEEWSGVPGSRTFLVSEGIQRVLAAREYNARLPPGVPRMKVWLRVAEIVTG